MTALRVACLSTSLLLSGCYSYTPVQTPAPGMDVRARLKPDAAVQRSAGLDDAIVRYDGIVTEVTPDAVALQVTVARSSSALQDVVIRDTVRLQTTEIQSITQRKVSPGRTALFTVAAAVAAFGIIRGIEEVVGGTEDTDNTPPTTTVVPANRSTPRRFRITLRLP